MAQLTSLKCKGLYTHPNELGAVPDGALLEAVNCVIDREDILENCRGSQKYGDELTNLPTQLAAYQDRLLVNHSSVLSYDSDGAGTWADYTGTISPPSGRKMRFADANQNIYFTTAAGIKKLDELTGTPVAAGLPKALEGSATLAAAGSGFLAVDNRVAYRIVWGYKDANENLVLGAPSQRFWVSNPAAGSADDVDLAFTIPNGITTSHIYQVYRSQASGGESIDANDELQLAYEGSPTSAQITAKEVTLTDITVDALLGATLYTSPSQEGIAQSNDEPPFAKDIAVYRDHTIYGNTEQKQNLFVTLIGTGTPSLGYYAITGDITDTSTEIADLKIGGSPDVTGLAVGMGISGTGIPAGATIVSIDDVAFTCEISAAATATTNDLAITCRDHITIDGVRFEAAAAESVANKQFKVTSGGSPADDIEDTAVSLLKMINQQTAGDTYGYYMSGYNDLPGKMWLRDRDAGGASWSVTSSKGSAFSPILPTTGTTVASSNEAKENRIYISKPGQPEAVPYAQWLPAGSADKELYRVIALRDSVFILKEDGIFRMTGTSVADFQISQFDNTAILKGIETAVALNNQVFAYTSQGVVAISDSGVQVVSRPVEIDLTTLSSDQYPNFKTIAFAVPYETERKYILFVPTETTDTYATQAYVYNSFTNAWTTWERSRTCAIVNPADDRLYMGNGAVKYIHKSRKDFLVTDYADDEYAVTVVSTSGTTITLASTSDAVVGQTIYQNTDAQAVVTEVTDGTHIEVDREPDLTPGSAKLYDPIAVSVQWAPVHGGSPGLLKQFAEAIFFFKEALFATISVTFGTNFAKTGVSTDLVPQYGNSFGDGDFGDEEFGGDTPDIQPVRTYVPLEQQRGHWLDVELDHEEACTHFALSGIALSMEAMETKFR